jgi:hypothetical protein
VGVLGGVIVAYTALSFVTKRLGKLRFRETMARVGVELILAVVAPIAFGLHLLLSNRRYLERGRVTRDADGTVSIGAPGLLARVRQSISRNSRAGGAHAARR